MIFLTPDRQRYAIRVTLPVIGPLRIEVPAIIRVFRGR